MILPENTQRRLIDEIALFVEYSVAEDQRRAALSLVERYAENPQALSVLLEFYKVLPESREEAVTRLAFVDSVQGVTLLVVSTASGSYGAVVSETEAHILGEYGKEPLPEEIVSFFGHGTDEELWQSYGKEADLPELAPGGATAACPVCQVATGEYHLLGCPVEICPWCDGQLNRCNCRFEQLDVEAVETDEQVEAFRELLEEKGRIPYKIEQKPGYPGTSKGLDR